jgi:3'-phosphoadenosine 5'-phosphosulfate sulfotransferase (PAPS reductase)/FAD synthetase
VFGFRAEESPARRKKVPFEKDNRLTNTLRHVDIWLPIHHWSTRDVWKRIKQAGTRAHWAYSRGMGRLSCRFCIFAPDDQLVIAGRQPENADLLNSYVTAELTIGHTFRVKTSLVQIREKVNDPDYVPKSADESGCWNM